MRFMIIIKATPQAEAGEMPPPEAFEAMNAFNQSLIEAGCLLGAEGLHPSSSGKRVTVTAGRRVVTSGPFEETSELVAGFWLIAAKSEEEAMAWVDRVPLEEDDTVELRRAFEPADFAEVVPAKMVEDELPWRAANQNPITNRL
jgi:hypothetical protein